MKKPYPTFLLHSLATAVLLLTGHAVSVRAQSPETRLRGVTCHADKTAVGYATVVLLSPSDSSIVCGTVADSLGRFMLKTRPGEYRMRITMIGYRNLGRSVALHRDTDLGTLVLTPANSTLGEVVVRPDAITREADRFVINVAEMPQAIGSDASDMLKLSPGVWVKDGISVYGRAGAKVYVNNRLLRETGEELVRYLSTIRAEDIRRIEVIPYPGAEFDADMGSGVIRITLRRKRDDGLDGSLSLNFSKAPDRPASSTNPSLSVNYRNGRLSLYTTAGGITQRNYLLNRESSDFPGTGASVGSSGTGRFSWSNAMGRVGATYEFNDRHSAGIEVNYDHNWMGMNMRGSVREKTGSAVTDVASLFDQQQSRGNASVSANYVVRLDTAGSQFKLLLDYYRSLNLSPSDYFSRYTGDRAFDSTYRSDINTLNSIYSATGAFEIALGARSKLRAGAKYTLNRMDNDTRYEYRHGSAWHGIASRTFENRYSENIGALYADFSTKLGRGIGLNVGLRGEYTYAVPTATSTAITGKQNYFGLFPSANLSIPLNEKSSQQIVLSYGRKISRPGFWQLNPYRNPLSEYSFTEGNPRLRPCYSSDCSVSWIVAGKYTLAAGFTSTDGLMEQIMQPDPDNGSIVLYRFENLPRSHAFNLNLNIPAEISRWWTISANLTGSNVYNPLVGHRSTFRGHVHNSFTIRREWSLDFGAIYMSPFLYGNMRVSSSFTVGLGLRRSFLNKKLTALVSVDNLINGLGKHFAADGSGLVRRITIDQEWRTIRLSVRYNFKAGKSIRVRSVESGAGEEKSRM